MTIKNATPENIAKLAKLLTDARDAYYNKTPTMSDAEYDRLEDVLRTINPNHPFFKTIGAPVEEVSGWAKAKHTIPMMSLNKAQTSDELKAWWDKYVSGQRVPEVLVTSKLDGISISIHYDKGILVKAVTRGDGETGEDITRNVKLMNVPQKIKTLDPVDVRGEIICRRSILAQYFPGESNCRNTASGTAKRQSSPEACKHLDILAYRFIPSKGAKYALRSDELRVLESEGFQTPLMNIINTKEGVETLYQDYIKTIRASLDYDIDGLVVEINSVVNQDNLGELNHRPTGAIAFKFPPETAESILRDIIWQVGNTGRITPVAVFDEVTLAGAKVTRASLHNIGYITRIVTANAKWRETSKQPKTDTRPILYVGDKILVSRRNEVIPAVEALTDPFIGNSGTSLEAPTQCPSCGSPLEMEGEYLVCRSDDCPAQTVGAIRRWIKKVGVLDWGNASIEALCESGLVKDPADLYTLTIAQIAATEMGGRKIGFTTATTMLNNLKDKMELPLHVFVGSLGIPMCSRSVCKMIVDAGYNDLDKMNKAGGSYLEGIPGIGVTKAQAFQTGFRAKVGLISKLLTNGVKVKAASTGKLQGKTFCMTGFRDARLAAAIEQLGGVIKSSVVKGLDYLIVVDLNTDSGKAQKARQQGTCIITDGEAWAMTR